ncbi:MAG: enoyl-CoA hydratase/isomerase family protein [Dehalococcoidia bacterium]
MSENAILTDVREGVLLATFNRPERMNTLSAALTDGLIQMLDFASKSDDVRVVVLTGAGRAWCAGAEIGGAGSDSERSRFERMGPSGSVAAQQAFAACDVPVVAAINGPAVGGGFGLAMCCDVRIAAESARIGSIFIRRGLATDYGAGFWLPRIVGVAKAYEILYSGQPFPAKEALALGIVNRVVPDADLMNEAMAYAATIAKGPPLAYTATRRIVQRSLEATIRDFPDYEWGLQSAMLRTEDGREGFKAFLEKREPEFKGR